jgi:CheY-like chemotaxis protein
VAQRRYKILLASNIGPELQVDEKFFRGRGFDVMSATAGPAALQLATSERPDLVILDQEMRELPGAEICSRLKAQDETKSIPVIISVSEAAEAVLASRLRTADAVAAKADGREHLLQVVSGILNVPARKYARISVAFPVLEGSGPKNALGEALDLSEGGMCLEVVRRYDVGSCLYLSFSLPGEDHEIEAPSWVCWIKDKTDQRYAMGMEFADLMESERRDLSRYIEGHLA